MYEDNIFLDSIGDMNHQDYPNYVLTYNLVYAATHRELYINRHEINADV